MSGSTAQQVVIIGRLASMTRKEAGLVVSRQGNGLAERITHNTSAVVLGGRGPQLQRNGRVQFQLARARRLIQSGAALKVLSEEEWLESLGLQGTAVDVRQRFTAGQIVEALGITRMQLDRWTAAGLVRPVDESAGIALFDYRQVTAARTLAELVRSGIRLSKIRHALATLGRWLPNVSQPLVDLSVSEDARRLIVRTPDGREAEVSGQLLFDFETPSQITSLTFTRPESGDEAFHRAIAYEQDRPLEAAAIYKDLASRSGPHATLAFNLGNALYAGEDIKGAQEAFQQATQLHPQHVGAWNNLANVLVELDQLEQAVAAYRRALVLDPSFADAHFNLAETLVELERPHEAVLHWRAYLAADPDSTWADYARDRLDI